MKRQSKIYLFKDRNDYIIDLTDDNIVNVIGTKGSGKTTSTLKYINDDDYIVINCDRLLELPSEEIEDKELKPIRDMLKGKYEKIEENESFIYCYNDIAEYIQNKKKKGLIEGNIIQNIKPITQLKGKVIIKRTGAIKCFIRAVKRDYPNGFFLKEEIEKHGEILGRIHRLKNIIKRRKNFFKTYHEIENIIKALEQTEQE